jgi:hypothetical protein
MLKDTDGQEQAWYIQGPRPSGVAGAHGEYHKMSRQSMTSLMLPAEGYACPNGNVELSEYVNQGVEGIYTKRATLQFEGYIGWAGQTKISQDSSAYVQQRTGEASSQKVWKRRQERISGCNIFLWVSHFSCTKCE